MSGGRGSCRTSKVVDEKYNHRSQIAQYTGRGLRLDPDPAANVPDVTSGPFPDHEFSIHGVLLSKSSSTNATLPA
jgi:hypothetical protein